jgi:hypothetical protein
MGGSGRALLGGVSVSSIVGTVLSSFTYDAPAVTQWRPFNVAMSELASVTLTGLSFGPGDSTVSATVGSVVCGTASWTTSTTVRFSLSRAPGGASAQLVLSVGDEATTLAGIFTFDGNSF